VNGRRMPGSRLYCTPPWSRALHCPLTPDHGFSFPTCLRPTLTLRWTISLWRNGWLPPCHASVALHSR
jgi:hypothetical protein